MSAIDSGAYCVLELSLWQRLGLVLSRCLRRVRRTLRYWAIQNQRLHRDRGDDVQW